MIPERMDSWMFHHPGVRWTHLQAQAAGIPQVTADVSGVKEEELGAMEGALRGLTKTGEIEGAVTGAIASEYQKSRVDRICDKLGLRSLAPLWGMTPEHLIEEQIELGFRFIMTACMAMGLDSTWLGRVIDRKAVDELKSINRKHGISLVFEGGEAETFVFDAPIFERKIRIVEARPIWKGDSGYLEIHSAILQDKNS